MVHSLVFILSEKLILLSFFTPYFWVGFLENMEKTLPVIDLEMITHGHTLVERRF